MAVLANHQHCSFSIKLQATVYDVFPPVTSIIYWLLNRPSVSAIIYWLLNRQSVTAIMYWLLNRPPVTAIIYWLLNRSPVTAILYCLLNRPPVTARKLVTEQASCHNVLVNQQASSHCQKTDYSTGLQLLPEHGLLNRPPVTARKWITHQASVTASWQFLLVLRRQYVCNHTDNSLYQAAIFFSRSHFSHQHE